jgi:hypothetical protein
LAQATISMAQVVVPGLMCRPFIPRELKSAVKSKVLASADEKGALHVRADRRKSCR